MKTIRVAVLRGGPSSEHEVSLKTGASVIENLSSRYQAHDIIIDCSGVWHVRGVPIEPRQALTHADVVWNALHGEYGEDGKVQRILDSIGVPYTGSGTLASALGMNKSLAKQVFEKQGIKTPKYMVVSYGERSVHDTALNIFRTMPMPVIIKPVTGGSSIGISIARDFQTLVDTLTSAFVYGDKLLIEEFIQGKEATVGVVERFRGDDLYSLMPIEIDHGREFFDFNSKYSEKVNEICPGRFSKEEKEELARIARDVHKALGASHYSRTDMIVHPKRGIFVLEVNTLPGLTEASLIPKALKAGGSTLSEFIDHVIGLALRLK